MKSTSFYDDESLKQMARKRRSSNDRWHWIVFVQAYFVMIAAILGIGILGLPVTLSHSGYGPLIFNLLIGLVAQSILVLCFTTLLQQAMAIKKHKENELDDFVFIEEDLVPLNSDASLSDKAVRIIEQKILELKHVIEEENYIEEKDEEVEDEVSLHTISKLFLPNGAFQIFDVLTIALFLSILISFALAGGQAYSEITTIPMPAMVPIFVWSLSAIIIFLRKIVQPFVSILTIVKCIVLIVTVFVTFFVGMKINLPVEENWSYIGSSFLMTTVSLGGAILVMPMLFARINFNRREVIWFNTALISALITVVILNILWCIAVLGVVPQTCAEVRPTVLHQIQPHENATHCNISLAWAKRNGQISTVPLTEIIKRHYPQYDWTATLIEVFIVISITVSYLTLGSALRHTLSGIIDTVWNAIKERRLGISLEEVQESGRSSSEKKRIWVTKVLIYISVFGIAFLVAMLNPKAFVAVLSTGASMFMNIQTGLFVPIMIFKARRDASSKLKMPCPMGRILYIGHFAMALYFLFAVVYDIVIIVIQLIHKS